MAKVMIRETTHHGTYRHVRAVVLESPVSRVDVAGMLASCAYPYVHVAEDRLAKVCEDLNTTGKAEHGWTRWEVATTER